MTTTASRYCVSAPSGVCFGYQGAGSQRALSAVLSAARRGQAILHCVKIRRRGRVKEICYLDRHKQPTNTVLMILAGLGVLSYRAAQG